MDDDVFLVRHSRKMYTNVFEDDTYCLRNAALLYDMIINSAPVFALARKNLMDSIAPTKEDFDLMRRFKFLGANHQDREKCVNLILYYGELISKICYDFADYHIVGCNLNSIFSIPMFAEYADRISVTHALFQMAYPSFMICGILLIDGDSVLLVKVTKFAPPKGKKMPYETPLECAIRETHEETGIDVKSMQFLKNADGREVEINIDNFKFFIVNFTGNHEDISPSREINAHIWLNIYKHLPPRDELPCVRCVPNLIAQLCKILSAHRE